MIYCLVVPIAGIIIATTATAALFISHIVDAGEIILSSCTSLPISRIVAAAVEVIDYEYYGNMVSGEECCGGWWHHDEGGVGFRVSGGFAFCNVLV